MQNYLRMNYFKFKFGNKITCKSDEKSRSLKDMVLLDTDVLKQLGYAVRPCLIYSPSIALNMCRIMSLVYEDQHTLELFCKTQNALLLFYSTKASLILFRDSNLIILAFAGTHAYSFDDWWVNITIKYKQEWDNISKNITDILDKYPRSNLVLCGHSKGGALAVYAAQELYKMYYICGCYVAGIPDKLIQDVEYQQIVSLKHSSDPVTALLSNKDKYWNVNFEGNGKLNIDNHRINSYITYCQTI